MMNNPQPSAPDPNQRANVGRWLRLFGTALYLVLALPFMVFIAFFYIGTLLFAKAAGDTISFLFDE